MSFLFLFPAGIPQALGLGTSDGFGPGPSPKARRPEAVFLSPARPEPDFLKYYSKENFGLGPKARRPEAIFLSPARPEPDFFQPDPSLLGTGLDWTQSVDRRGLGRQREGEVESADFYHFQLIIFFLLSVLPTGHF